MSNEATEAAYDSRPETLKHIEEVRRNLNCVIGDLRRRSGVHDDSKLKSPELEVFDRVTPRLKTLEYDSSEYKASLVDLGDGLKHHYEVNDHHPEHFPNGIRDMNLVQIVEMLCDWSAACKRHDTGDIRVSIEKNQARFGYSDELKQIFLNTLPLIESPVVIASPEYARKNAQDAYGDYSKAAWDEAVKDLSPSEVLEVAQCWTSQMPEGFWETVSPKAHSAIMYLCGVGLG